jgi:hypothetical protein
MLIKSLRFFIRIVAVLCITASTSAAALLVYEGFDYPVEDQLTGKTGGIGFGEDSNTNPWFVTPNDSDTTISSGSLSYPDLVTTGNVANFKNKRGAGSNATLDRREFSDTFDSGTIWASFLLNVTSFGNRDIRSGFRSDDQNTTVVSDGEDGKWTLRGNGTDTSTVTAELNETYFFVFKFNLTDGELQWWINPDVGGTSPVNADYDSGVIPGITNLTGMNYFSRTPTVEMGIDEIRLGDSFGDVAPINPEPSTVLVLIVGLAALCFCYPAGKPDRCFSPAPPRDGLRPNAGFAKDAGLQMLIRKTHLDLR